MLMLNRVVLFRIGAAVMNRYFKFIFLMGAAVLVAIASFAAQKNTIVGLDNVINAIKSKSTLPVYFPPQVPLNKQNPKLYANYATAAMMPDYNRIWFIYVDTTPICQGTHICNIGLISAQQDGKLTLTYNPAPDWKPKKAEKVMLKNHKMAYFTPFYVAADAVNPTLQWQDNGVVYTLRWQVNSGDAKKVLINMANSAIQAGAR